jgi:ubiquinone/menaquinone biosynthesis C-methylase UbiE
MNSPALSFARALTALEALGEPTRLRLARLLADAELTVTELTAILGQSQPRVSRHLKLMVEAGLVERNREGAWAFFRLNETGAEASAARDILARLDAADSNLYADRARLAEVRAERARQAEAYFARHATDWDRLRSLHVAEAEVERALMDAVGQGHFEAVLDLGTGTGRIMELLAGRATRAVGVDASAAMLSVARARLDRAGLKNVQLRHGDIYALPVERNAYDVVVIHQVLHYLDDPARAVREAARALRPGGRLVVADFAPHGHEFLRDEHAHRRLGFEPDEINAMLVDAGLETAGHSRLSGGDSKLTVIVWQGRDPRMLSDMLIDNAPRLREIA